MRRALVVVLGVTNAYAEPPASDPTTVTAEGGAEADTNVKRVESRPGQERIAAAVGRLGAKLSTKGKLAGVPMRCSSRVSRASSATPRTTRRARASASRSATSAGCIRSRIARCRPGSASPPPTPPRSPARSRTRARSGTSAPTACSYCAAVTIARSASRSARATSPTRRTTTSTGPARSRACGSRPRCGSGPAVRARSSFAAMAASRRARTTRSRSSTRPARPARCSRA